MDMKTVKIVCALLILILVAGGSFLLGRMTAPSSEPSVTFYATIDKIPRNLLTVSELEINDINTRGHFSFTVRYGAGMAVHRAFPG